MLTPQLQILSGCERAVLSVLTAIVACLKGALKSDKPPTEAQLLSKYDKLCVAVDEVIHEARFRSKAASLGCAHAR